MEFLKPNFVNTVGVIDVPSDTATSNNLFNRDLTFQWASTGFNNDSTIASLKINFNETQTVSRIALMNHNLKEYNVFFDGVTANTFSLSTTASTITSQFSSNSETSQFMTVTPQDCTSVTFDLKATQLANSEKAIGFLAVTNEFFVFERVPAAKDYKPINDSKEVLHRLSDGGERLQIIGNKFKTQISFKHITKTFRDNLRTVYDSKEQFMFAAFPTTTAWDEILFPVIWPGDFDFLRFSDNAVNAGFRGRIKLSEVPT